MSKTPKKNFSIFITIPNTPSFLLVELLDKYYKDKYRTTFYNLLYHEDTFEEKKELALRLLPEILQFYGKNLDEKYFIVEEHYGGGR